MVATVASTRGRSSSRMRSVSRRLSHRSGRYIGMMEKNMEITIMGFYRVEGLREF